MIKCDNNIITIKYNDAQVVACVIDKWYNIIIISVYLIDWFV